MPAAPATRAVLRQSRFLLRRNNLRQASTAAETASKAKETASDTASKVQSSASTGVSKASEGLTRVQSSAGSAITGAATSAKNALSKVGGRTGRLISFVESLIPPTVYYARVGMELSKIVFQSQKMTPPSIAQFQSYLQPLTNAVRHPRSLVSTVTSVSPEGILNSIRNVNRQQLATIGIAGAEVLGFFTVGTMIGRLKVVGYHGEPHHEH